MNPAIAISAYHQTAHHYPAIQGMHLMSVDEEHATLTALQQRISAAIQHEPTCLVSVDAWLDEWLAALNQHFTHEETAMNAVDYPYAALHRQQHLRAIDNIALHVGRWKRQRNVWAFREFMDITCANWFNSHARNADTAAHLFITRQEYVS